MQFTEDQLKLIYNAVRYYQINGIPLNSKYYQQCDEILNGLFKTVKQNYVEPGFQTNV
jgi:hypothetical protein